MIGYIFHEGPRPYAGHAAHEGEGPMELMCSCWVNGVGNVGNKRAGTDTGERSRNFFNGDHIAICKPRGKYGIACDTEASRSFDPLRSWKRTRVGEYVHQLGSESSYIDSARRRIDCHIEGIPGG